jgi:hypothetical protein
MSRGKRDKLKARAKAHIRYKQLSGKRVAGITTILNLLTDANVLARWANNLGLDGINSSTYVDTLARVGTFVHYRIECDLQDMDYDTSDFTGNEIEKGNEVYKKYEDWKSQHKLVMVAMEKPLVSELHAFGGTGDFFGYVDDVFSYIDFKTSKGCYLNHKVQAVACAKLWEERVGDKVEDIRILRFGRNEKEGFEEIHVTQHDKMWEMFLACLKVYQLEKEISK